MVEYTPPTPIPVDAPRPWVFLAGSIEQGIAPNWQAQVASALKERAGTLANPRRADWDASWKQDKGDSLFREQVEWELNMLEQADQIIVYFAPDTKAPITLLELGLFAASGKLVVACPEGYWRKGNVDIVCERYGVRQVADVEALIQVLKG
ncbi:MAG: nucleoside 2-deoxyribosyltransferase domain-containing protein [Polyangiales bacterium]